jgi:hypothetical protein
MSVTVPPEATGVETGPVLPAASVTALAASRRTTVPAEQEATETVIEEPELAEGVNTQPVAVPAFEKSAEVSPVTASEKARV